MKETSLFDSLLEEPQKPSGPVTCLGMTFENDEARRAHFTEELRKMGPGRALRTEEALT